MSDSLEAAGRHTVYVHWFSQSTAGQMG